jgi:hypothetical protein
MMPLIPLVTRRWSLSGAMVLVAILAAGSTASAQTPAHDPSEQLRAVLPADVADRVLAKIADARARQLPAAALEHRANELVAKGARPDDVERGVTRYADQLGSAQAALAQGGRTHPSDDETEAAASVIGKGVDGASVSALAQSAPSGRSLAVPLYVLSSLQDRGLPSDQALARVQADLQARLSDRELQDHAGQSEDPHGKPAVTGRDLGASKRPASAGRPSTVPANGGQGTRPVSPPARPDHPSGRP